jgi:hypothetical protein
MGQYIRDASGRFAGSTPQGGAVQSHAGRKSVGTHKSAFGYDVHSFNASAQRFQPELTNKRRAVAERVALRMSADLGRGTAPGFALASPAGTGAGSYYARRANRSGRQPL